MLHFNKLLPNKLYRTRSKITLPKNKQNNGRDNLVTFLVDDSKHMMQLLENPYWEAKQPRYQRYYIPKRMTHKVTTRLERVVIDRKDYFADNILPNIPENLKINLVNMPGNLKNYNAYYDMTKYIEWINTDNVLASKPILDRAVIKAENIAEVLKKISEELPLHDQKYLYIPIDLYIDNPRNRSYFSANKMKDNPVVYMLDYMETNYIDLATQLPEWTFVFTNVNELFFVPLRSLSSSSYTETLDLIRACRSHKGFAYVDETDDENDEVTVDDGTDDTPVTNIDAASNKAINRTRISVAKNDVPVVKKPEEPEPEKPAGRRLFGKTDTEKQTPVVEPQPVEDKPQKVEPTDEEVKHLDEAKRRLVDEIERERLNVSHARMARLKVIQEQMKSLSINDKSFDQIKEEAKHTALTPLVLDQITDINNEDMKEINFGNFEADYNSRLRNYDILGILESFAYKDVPLYLIDVSVEDISDNIDKVERYTCTFEDNKGKRHTLVFDLPKMIDNRFMHLGGSKKLIITQQVILPLTKTAPDTVQVASNYKKIFIYRFGQNLSPKISKFNKVIDTLARTIVTYKRGNSLHDNMDFMTTLEYDELSSKYTTIEVVPEKIVIHFNQANIREICRTHNLVFDESKVIPFAIDMKNPKQPKLITLDFEHDVIMGYGDGTLSPIDFIIYLIENHDAAFKKEFLSASVGKRYIYTRAKVMHKFVPLVILLSAIKGLSHIMALAKINYEFLEKRPTLQGQDKVDKGIIEFKDGYLLYDQYPFANALLMNGLFTIPTKEYSFFDFDIRNTYYNLLQTMYGRKNLLDAFENYDQLFIDVPITRDVLIDHHLPTDFSELLLVANKMLENNAFTDEASLTNFRYRNNELVAAFLYQALSEAYEGYRLTADNRNPKKFTMKPNQVIKDILESHLTEEYSKLSPIFEIERVRSTSMKGPGGVNMDRAFSISKRSFDPTMLGVMGQSSPISANIGISRVLSIDPNITSLRGYIKTGSIEGAAQLKSTQMLSGAELLVPLSASHDDPQRVSMMSIQSRHTMPVVGSGTALFGTGFDRTIAYLLSNDYAYKAKQSGKILSIDNKLGIMLIEYADGKRESVDISDRQAKNASGGFYVTNKLTSLLEPGQTFIKGEIIAADLDYFAKVDGNVILKTGTWATVGVIHSSSTFEDSTIVTEALAEKMSSYVTHEKPVTLGKNSNIYHMVSIGDEVKANEPLLVFDESYEDEYLNKILAKMSEGDMDSIVKNTQTPIKSKRNGKVVDIRIYYTVPLEEMSDTLREVITQYEKNIAKRNAIYIKNGINIKDLTSQIETTGMSPLKNDKLKGVQMGDNHVLIEFFVREYDKFGVGDKLTFDTALKGINQDLIPRGKEPILFSNPDQTVDAFVGVSGVYARMTNSFNLSMAMNHVLLGLERRIKDIYEKRKK